MEDELLALNENFYFKHIPFRPVDSDYDFLMPKSKRFNELYPYEELKVFMEGDIIYECMV